MEVNNVKKNILLLIIAIFAAASVIILLPFMISKKASYEIKPDVPDSGSKTALQIGIQPNSGGIIPDFSSTAAPEPLRGMDSPLLCKLELAGLRGKAEKTGADGFLTINQYDAVHDICILDIRNMKSPGNLGEVRFSHTDNEGVYGIEVLINRKYDEQLESWSKAALLYLNSKIGEKEAEEAVRKAITEGKAESDLFSASTKNDVLIRDGSAISVRVMRISAVLSNEE